MTRACATGLVGLFLLAPASWAADWNGSYSADGRCFCTGTLDASLAARIVPTPRGGQSVARICRRLGPGPGLSFADGRFDRVVYADAQCGHGPTVADAPIDADCAGTMEPGGDDCRASGPRWDLASLYARPTPAAAVEAAAALIGGGVGGTPAAVPVMGAAAAEPAAAERDLPGRVVEIDGRRWREAPLGTPETGPPGTRIILDGRVYLDVAKASAEDFLPRAGRAASARRPAKPKAAAALPTPKPASSAPRRPAPETRRERNARLLAEARQRLRDERGTSSTDDAPASASRPDAVGARVGAERAAPSAGLQADPNGGETVAKARAEETPTSATAGETSVDVTGTETSGIDDAADVTVDAGRAADRRAAAVERSVETIAATETDEVETVSPLARALRLPSGARASSREFGYVDAMPTSYHYGGGGMMLEGSAALPGRFRALARVGAASDYSELLLGGSWYATPPTADRLTVVLTAGVETGRFALERDGVSTELSDSGLYVGAASRLVVNDRFELQAGVGYSSFFEGDPIAFGGGYYHVAPRLDVVSRIEVGDNDSLGIGVRYYY